MSVAKVLPMDEYRDRRQQRFEIACALHSSDEGRAALVEHLGEISSLSGADRVAVVWVDEYGPGLVHPHLVVDLLQATPRRSFPIEPLRLAWEAGVPGAYEAVGTGTAVPGNFTVALGSDGTRAWFVVADSVAPRAPLAADARDRLMFLCGECSAIALHRDLDDPDAPTGRSSGTGFAGWPLLHDIEGREDEEEETRRVAQRFAVARTVRMLVDEDLVMVPERLAELVGSARRELAIDHGMDLAESELWSRALDLCEESPAGRCDRLADVLVDLGQKAEDRGHERGSEELYHLAFHAAGAVGATHIAVRAARFLGRVHRRQARREDSARWYGTALRISIACDSTGLRALSLSGLASLTQERGNLPIAREMMGRALDLALESGEPSTIATLHRASLSLEYTAGALDVAVQHGWAAVGASVNERDRTRSLASLAGILGEVGDFESACDAWAVVAATTDEVYLEVFALDGLAQIRALQGDADGFDAYVARVDELPWASMPTASAQVLYDRGIGSRALGRLVDAERWLTRAVEHAEQHGLAEMVFRAEEALESLSEYVVAPVAPTPAAPPAVREGVRAMRLELVGAAY